MLPCSQMHFVILTNRILLRKGQISSASSLSLSLATRLLPRSSPFQEGDSLQLWALWRRWTSLCTDARNCTAPAVCTCNVSTHSNIPCTVRYWPSSRGALPPARNVCSPDVNWWLRAHRISQSLSQSMTCLGILHFQEGLLHGYLHICQVICNNRHLYQCISLYTIATEFPINAWPHSDQQEQLQRGEVRSV